MAYDKVVDSAELDAGLKKVADAIRDKTGDTEALTFPDGMVDNLESLDHIKALKMAYVPFAKGLGWNGENVIEDGTTSINSYTYYGNYYVYARPFSEMPDSVQNIAAYGFAQCPGACFRKLSEGLTEIKEGSFAYLPNLALETLPEGVVKINKSAFDCDVNLALTKLPDSLTYIGESAFRRCCMMNIRELPPKLETIATNAFYYCYESVKVTRIPAPVKNIGSEAFRNCTGMRYKALTFEGTPESIASNAFLDCHIPTLNVPWAKDEVANAPWGVTGTINYSYKGE